MLDLSAVEITDLGRVWAIVSIRSVMDNVQIMLTPVPLMLETISRIFMTL
jgi:hypothetical protein